MTLFVMLLVVNTLPLYRCNPASVLQYLINHSWFLILDFSLLPTELEVCHSHEIRTLQRGLQWIIIVTLVYMQLYSPNRQRTQQTNNT